MREADIVEGLRIGGRNITDDTGLITSNVTTSKRILYREDSSGKAKGLGLNAQ